MRANRGTDTGPELALRRLLHARGWRYRVNHRVNVGESSVRPDVVFTRRRVAVFVDGCFWHGCPQHMSWPKSNEDFWRQKIERNMRRDQEQDRLLKSAGWRVVRIWEHEPLEDALSRVEGTVRATHPG